MKNLKLRVIKAKHGDSLLLFADGATVLIDGGPNGVYSGFLRDRLSELAITSDDPAHIDLLMVSHIDADHIDGILDLTDELLEARDEERDPLVRIDRAWHNSFSDMIVKAGVETATQNNVSTESLASALEAVPVAKFDPHDSKLVLASVGQGRRLRRDLSTLNVDLNKSFKDRLVLQGNSKKPWKRGKLSLSVIGPTHQEMEKLRKEWAKQLKKILAKEGAMTVAGAKGLDMSVSNLASIVAVAEAGSKTCLLTGDARGDMIIGWLEKTGWLKPNKTVHFNILKLPHHGSDRNVNLEFFKRVTADHYVMCGNGGHGNPEPGTFELLFKARPKLNYTIHMTYGPEELKASKSYIKSGNPAKLDAVLNSKQRLGILNYPKADRTFIDIVL